MHLQLLSTQRIPFWSYSNVSMDPRGCQTVINSQSEVFGCARISGSFMMLVCKICFIFAGGGANTFSYPQQYFNDHEECPWVEIITYRTEIACDAIVWRVPPHDLVIIYGDHASSFPIQRATVMMPSFCQTCFYLIVIMTVWEKNILNDLGVCSDSENHGIGNVIRSV